MVKLKGIITFTRWSRKKNLKSKQRGSNWKTQYHQFRLNDKIKN